jgi:hypothetical protein
MIEDVVVLLPSVLGYVLSSFQVLVILWCRGLLPWELGFLLLPCGPAAAGEAVKADSVKAEEMEAMLSTKVAPLDKQKGSPLDTPRRSTSGATFGAGDTAAGGDPGWVLSPLNARGAGSAPKPQVFGAGGAAPWA